MKGNLHQDAISHAKYNDVLGQCCHITLSNGIEAIYLNGQFITDADPSDGVASLLPLARSIARASDCKLNCYAVHEPDDEEWAWNDVVTELEQRERAPATARALSVFTPDCLPVPRGLLIRLLSLRK